jgi:Fe-Mn family superoxide dismutase
MLTRREALKQTVLASALCVGGASVAAVHAQQPAAAPAATAGGPFSLPPLPYPVDALEPAIDARTMEIHHDRHHAAYVAGLNKAIADEPSLAGRSLEELLRKLDSVPEKVRAAVRNHGGGHANHALFWELLRKNNGVGPKGELARALDQACGSFAGFQEQFTKAALSVFGSGWAWLTLDAGKLRIETTPNQDSPLTQGRPPLLGLDVWEHAYYLKYQNRRADYVAAFYTVINWDAVAARHQAVR